MQRAMVVALVVDCAIALATGTAKGETHASAPAGGGAPAMDVTVDLAAGEVRANATRIPIPLQHAKLPGDADVLVESIAIGQGKHVVRVRVPVKGEPANVAWEAILGPGKAEPIFAGLTGPTGGDPGERTGKAVQVVGGGGEASFVLVGETREDLTLCGQSATLLDPMAVYPADLSLRPATVQRLSAEAQSSARPIAATDAGPASSAPLARLLVARGSSVPGSRGAELTDGDLRTAWSERRPGVGQGEFVVMAAPRDVPISRMRVVVAPQGTTPPNGAAPKTFYLVTSAQTFAVELPDGAWSRPGESYEFAFPEPIDASCVAIVLDAAQTRDLRHPDVGLTELLAYSEFDVPGAGLGDVAKALSGDRRNAAAQVLERAGDGALAAVEGAYDGLDARGRALAIDVAAAHDRCDEAAPLLGRALCEKDGQAPRKAREKLERCAGAAPVLAEALRHDAATRACIAPALAAIAPQVAAEPIADALSATPEKEVETRAVLREALAVALSASPEGKLAGLLSAAGRSPGALLEILRAAGGRVAEAMAESEAALAEIARGSSPMRVRYLILGPLEVLARAGDQAAAARVAGALAHDEDWPVRARAAEAESGLSGADVGLAAAARDAEPRVREAALQALASSAPGAGVEVAASLLGQDGWPFVRVQAVGVLGKAAASPAIDAALAKALHDGASSVRGAAVVGLARHRAIRQSGELRARLDDPAEDADVRTAAAEALGAVCDVKSADRLTSLARSLVAPGTSEEEQQVAFGALVGLAALHPSDLHARIEPLLSPSAAASAREAARQALAARAACPAEGRAR